MKFLYMVIFNGRLLLICNFLFVGNVKGINVLFFVKNKSKD